MPQISHIKYKDIIEAWRFDPEFFKPEFLNAENLITSKSFSFLWNFFITDWEHGSPERDSTTNIKYVTAEKIKEWYIDDWEFETISLQQYNRNLRASLKPNDLLIYSVWVNCWLSAVFEEHLSPASIPRSVAMVRTDNAELSRFLCVFLISKYWKAQTKKLRAWNAQPMLALEQIKKIKYPLLNDEFYDKIAKIYNLAYSKRQKSKQLYQEAKDLLLTELWLKNHTISHTLTFSTTKKAVDEAWRYDADYFQPKYDELIEKIENYKWGWDYVENLFKYKKWFEPWAEAYTQEWIDFIRVSDFTKFWIEGVEKKISEKMYDELKENYQAKKWEILFTKDWTIWITYVLKEDLEWIISSAFLRLNLKEKYENYEKECLALILNSIICKLQVERFSWWALISHLKPSDFEKIKIPLINPQLQKEISDKIKESFKLRNESKELLEQAKQMVEDEIEKE